MTAVVTAVGERTGGGGLFVDEARVFVRGGAGGRGCLSFRHEKYVPRGGPDGGDGGHGGSVVFIADAGLGTLLDFKYRQHFFAKHGGHGSGGNRHGRSAPDLEAKVPPGTVVLDDETGAPLCDIVTAGQRAVVGRGGRGGRGNARFATPTAQAPHFAELGEPGEERRIRLVLKLIADVGLIGLPNAGKSTLLGRVSAARPRVADYPFTTLAPCLGVVDAGDGRSFVWADLPGLIAGAHAGAGLGLRFLRHVERTRVLLHILDIVPPDGADPAQGFATINREIALYSPVLGARPQVVAANKMDQEGAGAALERLRAELAPRGIRVVGISALTGAGVAELVRAAWAAVAVAVAADAAPEVADSAPDAAGAAGEAAGAAGDAAAGSVAPATGPPVVVRREGDTWVVGGRAVDRLVQAFDLSAPDARRYVESKLARLRVEAAVRRAGGQDGDEVAVGPLRFELGQSQARRGPAATKPAHRRSGRVQRDAMQENDHQGRIK